MKGSVSSWCPAAEPPRLCVASTSPPQLHSPAADPPASTNQQLSPILPPLFGLTVKHHSSVISLYFCLASSLISIRWNKTDGVRLARESLFLGGRVGGRLLSCAVAARPLSMSHPPTQQGHGSWDPGLPRGLQSLPQWERPPQLWEPKLSGGNLLPHATACHWDIRTDSKFQNSLP